MDTKKLLEKANERVVGINKLMAEIESFDGVIEVAQGQNSEIAFCEKGIGTTYINTVLSLDIMKQLKGVVMDTIIAARDIKIMKLKELVDPEPVKLKPAILNQEFEQAVKEMEDQGKDTVAKAEVIEETKPELTVEKVRELYIDQNKTIVQVSKELKIPKSTLFSFIKDNGLQKPSKKDKEIYRDSKVQDAKKKPF